MVYQNEEFIYKTKLTECPKCGFKTLGNMQYGLPCFDDELMKEIESGETILGGCCLSDLDCAWMCTKCKSEFYREEDYIKAKEKSVKSTFIRHCKTNCVNPKI